MFSWYQVFGSCYHNRNIRKYQIIIVRKILCVMFTNILQYIICNRLYQWTPSLIIASLYYLKYSKFLFRQWVLPSKEKVIDLLTKFTPSISLTCLNYEMSFAAFKSFIRGSLFFLGQPLWKIFLMAWWNSVDEIIEERLLRSCFLSRASGQNSVHYLQRNSLLDFSSVSPTGKRV